MSATFSNHIRGYSANAFVDSLLISNISPWITSTSYSIGNIVYNGVRKYIAASAGVSGSTAPSHVSGTASDGGVSWIFVENLNIDNNYKNNLYVFYAKKSAWTNEVSPDSPVVTNKADYTLLNDIIAVKKLTAATVKIAARRHTWTSGQIYTPFDSTKDPLNSTDYPTPFYVLTSNLELYKCLDNNSGAASTSEPSGKSLTYTKTADNYIWFYMGTLSSVNALLMSYDYIPLETKTVDDSTDQWLVQQNAKTKSISTFKVQKQNSTFTSTPVTTVYGDGTGALASQTLDGSNNLSQVYITTNPGTGYTYDNTYAITKLDSATGSGATLTPVIYYNSISGYTIVSGGTGYTTASATVVPIGAGSGATASLTLSGGVITAVTITNPGNGYTSGATLLITGNGVGANITLTTTASGVIGELNISAGGSSYTDANIIILGDGTNATATVSNITSGAVSGITIINRGTGYTSNTKVYVIPGTAGAVSYPVMAPITGHGYNIAAELACNTALISVKVNASTDLDYFEVDAVNGFRQVGLIGNLLDKTTSLDCDKDLYIGPAHSQYTNSGSLLNKFKQNYGYVLYLNNITKTVRSTSQEEEFKIAISY